MRLNLGFFRLIIFPILLRRPQVVNDPAHADATLSLPMSFCVPPGETERNDLYVNLNRCDIDKAAAKSFEVSLNVGGGDSMVSVLCGGSDPDVC